LWLCIDILSLILSTATYRQRTFILPHTRLSAAATNLRVFVFINRFLHSSVWHNEKAQDCPSPMLDISDWRHWLITICWPFHVAEINWYLWYAHCYCHDAVDVVVVAVARLQAKNATMSALCWVGWAADMRPHLALMIDYRTCRVPTSTPTSTRHRKRGQVWGCLHVADDWVCKFMPTACISVVISDYWAHQRRPNKKPAFNTFWRPTSALMWHLQLQLRLWLLLLSLSWGSISSSISLSLSVTHTAWHFNWFCPNNLVAWV